MSTNYKHVKLTKEMYSNSYQVFFAEMLENVDPSDAYVNTPLEGLDAYQRQLKRFDIKVRGENSDTVEKFFQTSESAVLFPEYVARMVQRGMEQDSTLSFITATKSRIFGTDYRPFQITPGESDEESILKTSSHVHLKTHTQTLMAPYEMIRFQRLDRLSVALCEMGRNLIRRHIRDAISVLRFGTTGQQPAELDCANGYYDTHNKLKYNDILEFWGKFDPYKMDCILASSNAMTKILLLSEFQSHMAEFNPLGVNIIHCPEAPTQELIGIDSAYALEQVITGNIAVDWNALIDKKFDSIEVSSTRGFSRLYDGAVRRLDF